MPSRHGWVACTAPSDILSGLSAYAHDGGAMEGFWFDHQQLNSFDFRLSSSDCRRPDPTTSRLLKQYLWEPSEMSTKEEIPALSFILEPASTSSRILGLLVHKLTIPLPFSSSLPPLPHNPPLSNMPLLTRILSFNQQSSLVY